MVAVQSSPSRAVPGLSRMSCRGPASQTPNAPDFHFNNVNAYHGRLKEWLRRFHGVATQNLPSYSQSCVLTVAVRVSMRP